MVICSEEPSSHFDVILLMPGSLSFARAVEKKRHYPLGQLRIKPAFRLNQMRADAMANRSKNPMGQLDRFVTRVQFARLLPFAHDAEHELEIAPPPRWVNRVLRDFLRRGKHRRENQPCEITMPDGKIEQSRG